MLVAGVAIKSRDYLSGVRPGPDAGAYAAAGMMVAEGRVLYKDVIHSAPMVALLDAAALKMGDGTFNAIRSMEVVFAVAGAWLALWIAYHLTSRLDLATLLALLFVLLASWNFLIEEGNLTEEFGMVFALGGVCAAIASAHATVGRRRWTFLALSGAAFGAAALSKEPFVLSSVPWLGYATLPRGGESWKTAARRAATFIGGMALVGAVFVGYLLIAGAFTAWADSVAIAMHYAGLSRETLSFAAKHAAVLASVMSKLWESSHVGVLLAVIGIVAAIVALMRRGVTWTLRPVTVVAGAGLLFEYYGASTSGRTYGHYYQQMLPSYFVLICCGAEILRRFVDSRATWRVGTLAVAALFGIDGGSLNTFRQQLAYPRVRGELGAVSMFVKAHQQPGDQLWSPSLYNSRYYVETGLTSPVSYAFVDPVLFQDTRFVTRQQRLERLSAGLRTRTPAWIVLPNVLPEPLAEAGIGAWIGSSYVPLPISDESHGAVGNLYVRRDRAMAGR